MSRVNDAGEGLAKQKKNNNRKNDKRKVNQTDTASFIIIIHHSLSAKSRRHQGLHTWTSSAGVFIFKFWHLAVSRPSP